MVVGGGLPHQLDVSRVLALDEAGEVLLHDEARGLAAVGDAGAGRTVAQTDNPFGEIAVIDGIKKGLGDAGYEEGREYMIMAVPNIVDISYGRGVGYTFTEHDLGKDVHDISATKIRAKMREEGKL